MQIKATQTALQNLLALIAEKNPLAPTSGSQISVGAPQAVTVPGNSALNTQLTLSAKPQQGYTGSVTVQYGRLPLSSELASPSTPPTIAATILDTTSLLAAIVSYHSLIAGEITWAALPSIPASTPGSSTVTVQTSGSLVYPDGQASLNLAWAARKTVLLFHFDGANNSTAIKEAGGKTATAGTNTVISTGQSKFGVSSLLPATGAVPVSVPDAPDLRLTGDFTIEGWVRPSNILGTVMLCEKSVSGASYTNRAFIQLALGMLAIKVDGLAIGLSLTSLLGVAASAWTHVAVTKKGSTWTIWINGASGGSFTSTATWGNNAGPFRVGSALDGTTTFGGNVDEFRVSNVARYTAAFTPPAAAFSMD